MVFWKEILNVFLVIIFIFGVKHWPDDQNSKYHIVHNKDFLCFQEYRHLQFYRGYHHLLYLYRSVRHSKDFLKFQLSLLRLYLCLPQTPLKGFVVYLSLQLPHWQRLFRQFQPYHNGSHRQLCLLLRKRKLWLMLYSIFLIWWYA